MNLTYRTSEEYRKSELKGIFPVQRLDTEAQYSYENAVSRYRLYYSVTKEGTYRLDMIYRKSKFDGRTDFPSLVEVVLEATDERARRSGL